MRDLGLHESVQFEEKKGYFSAEVKTPTDQREVTSYADLLVFTRLSYSTVSLETTKKKKKKHFILNVMKRSRHWYEYSKLLALFSSFLPFLSLFQAAPKGKKGPSCVKSETGLIPVSCVHKREQLCIQNLKKYGVCICKKGERWNKPSYAYKTLLSWHLGQLDAFPENSSSNNIVAVKTRFG